MPVFRTSWNSPVQQLRDEIDRLFSSFAGSPAVSGAARLVGVRAFPSLNVWEEGDQLLAEAEVPGLKSEDLEIAVVGNELTLKGNRPEQAADGTAYHRRERGLGPFTRVVRLPVDVDATRVEARLTDGVLLIRMPKSEAAKPRKIQVRAS